jgi:divalent metal cation (Fe/Co/Zn/Cd) transporter
MQQLTPQQAVIWVLVMAWTLFWKGLALWKSAKHDQRNWFIAILALNTFGILELLFLFRFAKKPMKVEELQFWKNKSHTK